MILTAVGTVELNDELVETSQYRYFVFTLYSVKMSRKLTPIKRKHFFICTVNMSGNFDYS